MHLVLLFSPNEQYGDLEKDPKNVNKDWSKKSNFKMELFMAIPDS